MSPHLKDQLAGQKIMFRFNPLSAPHFGGTWEREVKSVKAALKVILKDQTVSETALSTVLTEVEGILNVKPLGNVSSDVADSWDAMILPFHKPCTTPAISLGNAAGGTARSWPTTSGQSSFVTTFRAYRRDRIGGRTARNFMLIRWSIYWILNSLVHSGLL